MGLGTFLSDWYGISGSIGRAIGLLEGHLRMNPSNSVGHLCMIFFFPDEQGLGDFLLEATASTRTNRFFLQTFP